MSDTKTIKVTIDNITIDVAPGTTILNAARQIGGERCYAAGHVLLQQARRQWR